jgi:ethanolamine ammonia-lyase small subunit
VISEKDLKDIVTNVIQQLTLVEQNKMSMPSDTAMNVSVQKEIFDDNQDITDLSSVDLQKDILVPNPADMDALEFYKSATTARIGVWRTGPRPLTRTILRFRADHAVAQDTVFKEVSEEFLSKYDFVRVKSKASDKDEFLTRPDLGKQLYTEDLQRITRECLPNPQVQIIIADGLSSMAIEANIPNILPAVKQGLKTYGLSTGRDIFVQNARMGIMDEIGMALNAEVVLLLIGERPGLGTSESMSAYMIYKPTLSSLVADHNVVSNIHKGGTPPAEAGAHISSFIKNIYDAQASGVELSKV